MNFQSGFDNLRFMLVVARRELTSILRGRAERFLFIWTSLLFVPLATVGILTMFLFMRSTDVLQPKAVAIPAQRQLELRHFIATLNTFPELALKIEDDPKRCFEQLRCDAFILQDKDGAMLLTSRNHSTQQQLKRVMDAARLQVLKQLSNNAKVSSVIPLQVMETSTEQYKLESEYMRHVVIGLYVFACLYSVIWLIPAIDIVRYDYLHNNLRINLCLPVPMAIVIGGKLISGTVITLIPAVLSAIAFAGSAAVALAIMFEYFEGGFDLLSLPLSATPQLPLSDLLLLPFVVVSGIAFLHAWLMMVVIFFQGQRLAVFVSTTSLFILSQLAVMYGVTVPSDLIWANAVPFLGLGTLVHQTLDGNLTVLGSIIAFGSTFALTAVMVRKAGTFYTLESWSQRMVNSKLAKYSRNSA